MEHAKPHPRWKMGDKSDRHPQTVEEWDYRNDPAGGATARSERRLNVAADYDDPRAPDQMALVLRIDLIRLIAELTHKRAFFENHRDNRPERTPPQGVTYSAAHDNFYKNGQGQGEGFYLTWRDIKHQFPTHEIA